MMSEKTEYPQVEEGSPLAEYERFIFTQIMLSMARSLRNENLSLAQVAALHLLGIKQELRIGEVAEAIGMQLPGASKVMGELVDRGLCARREDRADRRAKVVSITPAGRALIEGIAKRRSEEASFAMVNIGGEVSESFNRLFRALYEAGFTKAKR
jgi:DNA-binding MarR family transcriptional regulator